MSSECEYCGHMFTRKYVLINHQKRAKYCIKIQQERAEKERVKRERASEYKFMCNICGCKFSTNNILQKHVKNCNNSEKYEQTISELTRSHKEEIRELTRSHKEEIRILQDKLENIALKSSLKPTVTNNNCNTLISNITPITDNLISQNSGNLTIDHIKKGAIGYAQYALDYPLKDNVMCVDYARRKVKYKDKDGNLVTDPEMLILLPHLLTLLSPKSDELIKYAREQIENGNGEMNFEDIWRLATTKMGLDKASNGVRNEFHNDMVKYICGNTALAS